MSNNTEPSVNSMNFRPVPMSMLNLFPLMRKVPESPATLTSVEDSDDSFLNKEVISDKENTSGTLEKHIQNQRNKIAEHRRANSHENKENYRPVTWNSIRKDVVLPEKNSGTPKEVITSNTTNLAVAKQGSNNNRNTEQKKIVSNDHIENLRPWNSVRKDIKLSDKHNSNSYDQRNPIVTTVSANPVKENHSSLKHTPNDIKNNTNSEKKSVKTPDAPKLTVFSSKKTTTPSKFSVPSHRKTPTPQIKFGIRKFTPGKYTPSSGRSYKKLKHKINLDADMKDSVRCLFPDSIPCPTQHQPEQPAAIQANLSSKPISPNHGSQVPHHFEPQPINNPVQDYRPLIPPAAENPAPNGLFHHPNNNDVIKQNLVPCVKHQESYTEHSQHNTEGIRKEFSGTFSMKKPEIPDTPSIGRNHSKIPETPINNNIMAKEMPTPSHPQGLKHMKFKFKTNIIKNRQYMILRKLGIGGSSEVYKVLDVATSSEYAVKCVNLATDPELARGYINEVRLLKKLQDSDRVVKLFDYEFDKPSSSLRVVLEVGETDLSSFLKARGSLQPSLVMYYWEEMLHAVKYIHDHGVIHADLKPANFLLVCGRLKLIDFGIASAVSSDATSVVRSQAAGTYSYISPEALMGGAGGAGTGNNGTDPIKISFRSDVWSLGCILYSMVYGRTPFGHIPNLAKLAVILDPNHHIDYPPAPRFPGALLKALRWCLTYNARARPLVSDLLAIEYFNSPST